MERVDRALQILIYVSLFGAIISGIWAILKLLGINPELEFLIPLITFILTVLFGLTMKLGRLQGRLKRHE